MASGTGRTIVITGGNGILAQQLAQQLLLRRNHVILIDDYLGFHGGDRRDPTEGMGKIIGSFEHVQADLRTFGDWASCFVGAAAVIHFAAVNASSETTCVSLEGSTLAARMSSNVIAASELARVRRLVVESSSATLGNYLREDRLTSDDHLGRLSSYRLQENGVSAAGAPGLAPSRPAQAPWKAKIAAGAPPLSPYFAEYIPVRVLKLEGVRWIPDVWDLRELEEEVGHHRGAQLKGARNSI